MLPARAELRSCDPLPAAIVEPGFSAYGGPRSAGQAICGWR